MSETAYIVRTKFTNLQTGEESFGVRVYDDYGKDYCNLWEKHEVPNDDIELFEKCVEFDVGTECGGVLDSIDAYSIINIDGTVYKWEDVKHIF